MSGQAADHAFFDVTQTHGLAHDIYVVATATYLEDVLLADRCLDGEAAAAQLLFSRQQRRVHATLYRVLGHNRDMDDLLQETFIEVFKSLRNYRGEARLSTWIDRITCRVAYRYLARAKKRGRVQLVDEPATIQPSAHRQAIARSAMRRFYSALDTLSPGNRLAFTLHELDGRSVLQVAECLGTSVTATKLRIWRARRTLFKYAATDPLLSEFLDTEHTRGAGQ